MLEKFKSDPKMKEKGLKIVAVMVIAAVVLLSLDVFTTSRDGRKQIVDEDGGTETELCSILADIDGVGAVDVMLQRDDDEKVTGVIVTAEGAGSPVVKDDLISAVMAVFNIPAGSVEVFEKKQADTADDDSSGEEAENDE